MKKNVLLSMSVVLTVLFNVYLGLSAPGDPPSGDPQCSAGGPGSIYCSYTYSLLGNTQECEVMCGSGFYACCYVDVIRPRCICKSSVSPPLI